MAFQRGQSGNPGGRKKAIGLSRAVRKSEGLKTWAKLLAIRDGLVLERKEIGKTLDGRPIIPDVTPSVKELRESVKLILAYTWGTPVPQGQDDIERRVLELEERLSKEFGKSLQ